jgi:hypothetical protein
LCPPSSRYSRVAKDTTKGTGKDGTAEEERSALRQLVTLVPAVEVEVETGEETSLEETQAETKGDWYGQLCCMQREAVAEPALGNTVGGPIAKEAISPCHK